MPSQDEQRGLAMISQTMQMSCEPPLSGKDGQKGTNSGAGVQMEWDPDPDHTDFEPEGEENMLVGEVINVLDNLESGRTETCTGVYLTKIE